IDEEVATQATKMAHTVADAINSVGILAVEMFLSNDGLTVNELALRPHNSGHWTMDGCVTSQFEQHLRAILDWPLGSTAMTAPATAMVNVLGPPDGSDPTENLPSALAVKSARVHLYGKQALPGRKLGHINSSAETIELALEAARSAAVSLVAT
ncbi:MAG: ATP-grasp domain-containing protein, partial [Actinobacteria bacterium]|nr:ATP-grasp domain-containing protein [Actinomycetota bacterium]